jgi:hypothetical protein
MLTCGADGKWGPPVAFCDGGSCDDSGTGVICPGDLDAGSSD